MQRALIEIQIESAVGVPLTIAQKAIERSQKFSASRKVRKTRNSFEEHDQTWAVFDRDDHPRFDEAVRLCEQHGVNVARSNPCFEVWLILHHEDFNKPLDRYKVQRHFQTLHPKYDCDGGKEVDASAILQHIAKAERLAQRQLKQRAKEGDPFGRPSTTVHLLTMAIRATDKKAG